MFLQRFNTVRGYTQTDKQDRKSGQWSKNSSCPRGRVWIVYENGRAYPKYLVKYYRAAARDPKRTPFESKSEAMRVARSTQGVRSRQQSQAAAIPGRHDPLPAGRPPPPLLTASFCHVAPNGDQHPYSVVDNTVIANAIKAKKQVVRLGDITLADGNVLKFEVRFGNYAKSSRMPRPPPSRMVQVNIDNENTRVVEQIARP